MSHPHLTPLPQSTLCRILASLRQAGSPALADFSPEDTRRYELPPWEVAKAFAFHKVIEQMEEVMHMRARMEFLEVQGGPGDDYLSHCVCP